MGAGAGVNLGDGPPGRAGGLALSAATHVLVGVRSSDWPRLTPRIESASHLAVTPLSAAFAQLALRDERLQQTRWE